MPLQLVRHPSPNGTLTEHVNANVDGITFVRIGHSATSSKPNLSELVDAAEGINHLLSCLSHTAGGQGVPEDFGEAADVQRLIDDHGVTNFGLAAIAHNIIHRCQL